MKETQYAPIWLSTWTFKVGDALQTVSGVVVKGEVDSIRRNPMYLRRAMRPIHGKASLVNVTLDRRLGEGVREEAA